MTHGPRLIYELDRNGCRFPVDQDTDNRHIFCNHPRHANSSYCLTHFKITTGIGTRSEREAERAGMKFARMEA